MYYADSVLNDLNVSWASMLLRCYRHYSACGYSFDAVCSSLCDCSFELFRHLADLDELFEKLTPVVRYDAYCKVLRRYVCVDFPIMDDIHDYINDFVTYIRYF